MSRKDRFYTKLKLIIEAVLFVACTSAVIVLRINGINDFSSHVLFFADAVIVSKILFDIHSLSVMSGVPTSHRIKKLFGRLLKPIAKRVSQREDRKYLKGTTETKIVFSLGIKDRMKDLFDRRTKVNPKRGKNNAEKIRMMYIKRILEFRSEGKSITPSLTPMEAGLLRAPGEDRDLFETYEHVRYEKNFSVSDDAVKKIAGNKKS